jgi:hypothetical protein
MQSFGLEEWSMFARSIGTFVVVQARPSQDVNHCVSRTLDKPFLAVTKVQVVSTLSARQEEVISSHLISILYSQNPFASELLSKQVIE